MRDFYVPIAQQARQESILSYEKTYSNAQFESDATTLKEVKQARPSSVEECLLESRNPRRVFLRKVVEVLDAVLFFHE